MGDLLELQLYFRQRWRGIFDLVYALERHAEQPPGITLAEVFGQDQDGTHGCQTQGLCHLVRCLAGGGQLV